MDATKLAGPFNIGDRIDGNYEVVGLLGHGAHAYVYDCVDVRAGKAVAIKVVFSHQESDVRAAINEASVSQRLNCSHIVKVDRCDWLDNGMAYVAMERLEGATLREYLRTFQRLTLHEALVIAFGVADALTAAHAGRPEESVPPIIHGNLKPENIFISTDFEAKLLEFVITKALRETTRQKDTVYGAVPYLSPEQLQAQSETFASDVFQLGTVLYEMICGICPCLVGVNEPTLQGLAVVQVTKLPPSLTTLVEGVPDHVDRLVFRAIAKDPEQRYESMREFRDAIGVSLNRLVATVSEREVRILPRRGESPVKLVE